MSGYVQRLGQFAWSGAKPDQILYLASLSHQFEPASRLEGADQYETVRRAAFDQHIQHPVNAVVKINIRGPGSIPLDKSARTRPGKGVGSLVIFCEIGFGFHDQTCTPSPDQGGSNQSGGADQRIASEKISVNHAIAEDAPGWTSPNDYNTG